MSEMVAPFEIREGDEGLWIAERAEPPLFVVQTSLKRLLAILPAALSPTQHALDGTLPFAVAQLRHAYTHLHAERVLHQREFAEGLIGPVIRHLEALTSSAKPAERD